MLLCLECGSHKVAKTNYTQGTLFDAPKPTGQAAWCQDCGWSWMSIPWRMTREKTDG